MPSYDETVTAGPDDFPESALTATGECDDCGRTLNHREESWSPPVWPTAVVCLDCALTKTAHVYGDPNLSTGDKRRSVDVLLAAAARYTAELKRGGK